MAEANSQDNSITLTEDQKKRIIDQTTNSICFIKNGYKEGEGFFCLIPNSDFAKHSTSFDYILYEFKGT